MGQHGGEALVVVLDGDVRTLFAPAVDKLLDTCQILAGLAVRLAGLANDDTLHGLTTHVLLQIIEQLRRRDSRQPACYDLQWVGDCQSCTFLSVVYR